MHDDLRPSLLAGLIGAGIQRSLSPAMHQQEGDAQGCATCTSASTWRRWA